MLLKVLNYKLFAISILLIAGTFQSFTQSNLTFETALESAFGTKELPFWIVSNQEGRYQNANYINQQAFFGFKYSKKKFLATPVGIELGSKLIANYSKQANLHFNEAFVKAYFKGWKLEGGLFKEPLYFDGISSTNGNIDRSNNARPYPRIRFSTDEFIPFFFWKKIFSFKAEYDEGILNDSRIVNGTRFHHKSLYAKVHFT